MEVMFLGCIKHVDLAFVALWILFYSWIIRELKWGNILQDILYSLDIILHRLMKFCNEIVHHVQTSP